MAAMTNAALPAAEHRTVARVMSILELVLASDPQGMRLGELSAAIDAPKSSVHGLAKGLVATGYFREQGGRYFAGPAISTLIAAGPTAVSAVFRHTLEQLTAKWSETSMLATLVGDAVVYLDAVESDELIRAAPRLNKRLPLWPRSAGKCFLAYMEPKRLDTYFRRHANEIRDESAVRAELAEIRETGVALNFGGAVAGHVGIASPVIVGGGTVSMSIVMAGPQARMGDHLDEITHDIRAAVEALTVRQALG